MKFTGTKRDIVNRAMELDDEVYDISITKYRSKRSLSANAYCWQLINQIANMMRKSKEDVYVDYLKHYGQNEVFSVLSEIDISGYFKYYEAIGSGTVNGKDFTHYRIFKGSSEYTTEEMGIFIEGIVLEAQNLGIETLTPNEIKELENK